MATYTRDELCSALKAVSPLLPLGTVEAGKGTALLEALSLYPAFGKAPWEDALDILWRMLRLAGGLPPRASPVAVDLRDVRIQVFESLIGDVRVGLADASQSIYGPTGRALMLAEEARACAAAAGRVDGALDAVLGAVRAKLADTVERTRGLRF